VGRRRSTSMRRGRVADREHRETKDRVVWHGPRTAFGGEFDTLPTPSDRFATPSAEHRQGRVVLTPALDRTLAGAGDGAFVVGADGRIVLWNRSAERILGYAARDVAGRRCCDIFDGRNDNGSRLCYQGCSVMTRVTMGEPVQTFDMRARTKTGKLVWISVNTLVVSPNGGAGALTLHLFRDVTATKVLLTLVQERLTPPEPGAGAATRRVLTRRELELLRLMSLGLNTAAAAERLHVSQATVRNHVQNILGKLGAHSRLEAVAYAHKHRLL
jgi:PAS domain S-box-containing protein